SATGSVTATGVRGWAALNAAMAAIQGCSDALKALRLASKYAASSGSKDVSSVATAAATAGIVLESYQRCGLGVLSGSPSKCCTSITLRPEFGVASTILAAQPS